VRDQKEYSGSKNKTPVSRNIFPTEIYFNGGLDIFV
jgi:hypothetical protein